MDIVIVGLGYIGLPTAIMFANYGQNVIGVDKDTNVIDSLCRGEIHLEEPGLQEAFTRALNKGNFKAQDKMTHGDVFIIAVPTPNNFDLHKSCDLSYVHSAVKTITPYLREGNTIIIESTISPGSTEEIMSKEIENAGFIVGKNIHLVHCPERVLPGQILHELKCNDRIIGGVTEACTKKGMTIYKSFVEGELIPANASVAELSKLAENTFRDVNIALANEFVKVGYRLGIDALKVIDIANKHPRVNIHAPGPGVGGHCLAVDPYFIVSKAPHETPIIQASRAINSEMPLFIVNITKQIMSNYNGRKITILGVTYKGNVDDIRESPALEILEMLKEETDYDISVFDPHVKRSWIETNFQHAIEESDLLLLLTDHDEFKHFDARQLKTMRQPIVFDTKNIISELSGVTLFNLGNIFTTKKIIEESK